MSERYDVVVVGARCAGASLAAMLAGRGLRVALVEKVTFPRDTLSTHVFQGQALAILGRLGLEQPLRATGTTFIERVDLRIEGLAFSREFQHWPGDLAGTASIRRFVLDPLVATAAEEAGATLYMGTPVTGLVRSGGRVAGVRIARNGAESELHARVVVGADGRSSTVAELAGARKYNVTANERFAYWSFFEGADIGPDPAFVMHRWGERFVMAVPSDAGLYQVVVLPVLSELPRYRQDLEGSFLADARQCEPAAAVIAGARRVGKIFGALRWEGYFRDAAGPGWVLVGDAGHFKDPAAGQGIQDALRQAEALAPVVARAVDASDVAADRALAEWWRWRDWDAAGHYWLAQDMGKAGPAPPPLPEIGRHLLEGGDVDRLMNVFFHRSRPGDVITPPGMLAATGRLLARRGTDRVAVLRATGPVIAENIRRQILNHRPVYVPGNANGAAVGSA